MVIVPEPCMAPMMSREKHQKFGILDSPALLAKEFATIPMEQASLISLHMLARTMLHEYRHAFSSAVVVFPNFSCCVLSTDAPTRSIRSRASFAARTLFFASSSNCSGERARGLGEGRGCWLWFGRVGLHANAYCGSLQHPPLGQPYPGPPTSCPPVGGPPGAGYGDSVSSA